MSGVRREIRVVHLLDGRWFGGAEQVVRWLIGAGEGVGVRAWAYCLSGGRLAEYLAGTGRVRVFRSRGRYDLTMLPAMARAMREDGIEVIQAHTSRTHLMARGLGRFTERPTERRMRRPNVTTIHSPIALDVNQGAGWTGEGSGGEGARGAGAQRSPAGSGTPMRARVERWTRGWTDLIVTVSEAEAARLVAEEGVARERVRCVANGVPALELGALGVADVGAWRRRVRAEGALGRALAERGLGREAFVVAMVAQMRPRKGPEVLLEAFARWRREHPGDPEGMVAMVGGDEFMAEGAGAGYLAKLKGLAGELGIGERVLFTGFVDAPWEVAGGADLFVLPSLFGEGLPLALLEAANHGMAVAASGIAGNREIVERAGNGWLHEPGDAAGLAGQLREAALDPEGREARGARGRRAFLERWTVERMAAGYREVYEGLLGRKSGEKCRERMGAG